MKCYHGDPSPAHFFLRRRLQDDFTETTTASQRHPQKWGAWLVFFAFPNPLCLSPREGAPRLQSETNLVLPSYQPRDGGYVPHIT